MSHTTSRARALLAVLTLLSAIFLGACGDDGGDDDAEDATATTDAGDGSGDEAGAETIAVIAADYEFRNLPDEVDAGTTFTVTNESTREVHELVALRLPDTEKRPAKELLDLPQAEIEALFTGPPATVIVAPPSQAGRPVVGDGSVTEPGRYLFACFIPTGASPEEFLAAAQASPDEKPEVAGGPPHFTGGMFADVTVR